MKLQYSLFVIILFWGCKEKLPVVDDFNNSSYKLTNQNNQETTFPDFVKGR